MDIETSQAIESLRGDIRRVETTLTGEIGKLRAQIVTRDELHGDMAAMREELHGDMLAMRTELHGDMAAMRDELKRHTDIRFESLRDDIRLVAEGFAVLSAKVDSL
jgi:hypothetical protein